MKTKLALSDELRGLSRPELAERIGDMTPAQIATLTKEETSENLGEIALLALANWRETSETLKRLQSQPC